MPINCECSDTSTECLSGGLDVSERCGCSTHGIAGQAPFCYVVEPTRCPSAEESAWITGVAWIKCVAPPLPPTPPPPPTSPPSPPCADTDGGATNVGGYFGCSLYARNPKYCGPDWAFDDSDFSSNAMCCTCGGGGPL
eukprot:scaffold9005_cov74-Phaeocystis_antarctica.AAC.1